MSNVHGKPIVLVITNIPMWPYFRKALGDSVEIRSSQRDPYEAWNDATKDGCRPDIIAIGCICQGAPRPSRFYDGFPKRIRLPEPDGPGFTGPIIGLCEVCWQQHLDAGCDEVANFGPAAAKRILELIEEKGIGKN